MTRLLGNIYTSIGGGTVNTRRAKNRLYLVQQQHYNVQLLFSSDHDLTSGRQLIGDLLALDSHWFRPCLRGPSVCVQRLNVKVNQLIKALRTAFAVVTFKVFVESFGCKHKWEDFKRKYDGVFADSPVNTWDLTLKIRDRQGRILMFRRTGKAGPTRADRC